MTGSHTSWRVRARAVGAGFKAAITKEEAGDVLSAMPQVGDFLRRSPVGLPAALGAANVRLLHRVSRCRSGKPQRASLIFLVQLWRTQVHGRALCQPATALALVCRSAQESPGDCAEARWWIPSFAARAAKRASLPHVMPLFEKRRRMLSSSTCRRASPRDSCGGISDGNCETPRTFQPAARRY